MVRRLRPVLGLLLAVVTAGVPPRTARADVVVHEWGTFTSRFTPDGAVVVWNPLAQTTDLPRFVYRNPRSPKNGVEGTVRMETPVVYVYSDDRQALSVRVDFPGGVLTEWYPRARRSATTLRWPRVTVLPRAAGPLRREVGDSHYYPARETDAAILRVRDAGRTQYEKFLFYRGVGTFSLPVSAGLEAGSVVVQSTDPGIDRVLVVSAQDGVVGHRMETLVAGRATVPVPTPTPTGLAAFEADLLVLLVGAGLYEREARAMLATWRSTWSENGLRAFYLVPRPRTDEVIPLEIEPAPVAVVRVLVGRAEIVAAAP